MMQKSETTDEPILRETAGRRAEGRDFIRALPITTVIETIQLICLTNQLTGFYMIATLAFNAFNFKQHSEVLVAFFLLTLFVGKTGFIRFFKKIFPWFSLTFLLQYAIIFPDFN